MKWLLLLICLGGSRAGASEQIERDPHHLGTFSSINVGFRYSSLLQNRGVVLYRDFQIDPIVAVFLLDDRVEFLGDSIGFRDFVWGRSLRMRTRLVSLTDRPLFPAHGSVAESSPRRSDTYELNVRAEFFLPRYDRSYLAEFAIGYSKDIKESFGQYCEAQSKLKLFAFREPWGRTLIEPNLFASIGFGDAGHNGYFYGADRAESGINNASYGLWLAFPEEADRYYPIVQIVHFETLNDFRSGSFATGRGEGWLCSFIATVGLL